MTTKYTPGPWMNDPLQPTIWADGGDLKVATIADLPNTPRGSDWMTEQANARLIASAPELLAALEEIEKRTCNGPCMSLQAEKEFERNSEANKYRTALAMMIIELRALAREAIAKAKGE